MREGKPAKNKGVHDRELRGYAGNSQGEDENGEKTKRFLFEKNAETDANILAKSIEDHMAELGLELKGASRMGCGLNPKRIQE